MNAVEQINAYKELRQNGQAFFVDDYADADRIIEALEKQIPKEPIVSVGYGYGKRHMCPICSDVLKYPYPCTCGQKINWGKGETE